PAGWRIPSTRNGAAGSASTGPAATVPDFGEPAAQPRARAPFTARSWVTGPARWRAASNGAAASAAAASGVAAGGNTGGLIGGLRWSASPDRRAARLPARVLVLAAVLVLVLVVGLGYVAIHLLSGSQPTAGARPPAAGRALARHRAATISAAARPAPSSPPDRSSAPAATPARQLAAVSARAFGVHGLGQGDSPQLAALAIDGRPGTAWHTDWYTSATFGNLYSGTGLLLDMGRPVTVTAVRVALGSAPGASLQVRVGSAPALASLPAVAHADGVHGTVLLRPGQPAHGRYVLIWFIRLPQNQQGTFQGRVYDVRITGRS
ncbi:MAG: hypothetical protein ACLP52_20555, partial [Streptosporangiaceae bacterium]